MRALIPAITVLILLTAAACGGADSSPSGSPKATPTTTGPSIPASTTRPPTATPNPTSLPPQDELTAATIACFNQGPDSAAAAASALMDCAASDAYTVTTEAAAGDLPVVLIDFRTIQHCFGTISEIAWRDGEWHAQSAEGLLPDPDAGTLITSAPDSGYADEDRARSVIQADGTYLGIIQANAECGSGPPQEGYLLLGLEGNEWKTIWSSASDTRTSFGHPVMRFVGEGVDRLQIDSDSWLRADEVSKTFSEANAGPHRYFTQTWQRHGDAYDLESEIVTPSPYSTLVEFAYAIATGDTARAAQLTTNDGLVQTAINLGWGDNPLDATWTGICGDGSLQGGPPCQVGPDFDALLSTVDLTQDGDDWLISAITPAPTP